MRKYLKLRIKRKKFHRRKGRHEKENKWHVFFTDHYSGSNFGFAAHLCVCEFKRKKRRAGNGRNNGNNVIT